MPLPPHLETNGAWEEVLERLHHCFRQIFFAEPRVLVQGQLLVVDGRCIDNDKEEGFWHIVSKGPVGNRLPDFERARRMPWIAAMLDGTAPGLSRWRYKEGSGSIRQYYWLEAERYVLILEEGRYVTTLITAYYVEGWGSKDLAKRRAKGAAF